MRTSVLNQIPHLSPPKDTPQYSDLSFKLKEQDCLTLLKKCKSMEDFKRIQTQILKLGLFSDSFIASNLMATCALSDWGSMDYACLIFRQMDEPTSFDFNTVIRGHVKDMSFNDALYLYEEMLERDVEPDNFTYPDLLKACARFMASEEGMQLHNHIIKLGLEDDLFVQNSLINMYGKCGVIELSCSVFEQIGQKSAASWSAMIGALAGLGLWWECLESFGEMNSEGGCRAEESIMVSVLSACTHLGALDLGRCTHGFLLRNITRLNFIVETSLIDMYVKCGMLEKGLLLFRKMGRKNQLSYSVMISGLGLHGHGREALKVFEQMLEEDLEPDSVVYVSILSACSRAGLVKEGLQHFNRMKSEHDIEPTVQHYGCIVDLMGRAGRLREAFTLIENMPIRPNDIIWRSLLGACKVHNNLELGKISARNLFQLNTHNPGDYVVLSNIYADANKWSDAAKVRTEIIDKGLIQSLGFSLVEVKRRVYKFVSQDSSHPKHRDIYEMIHQIEWQLRFEGYSPDTSQVMLNVDEDEKRERLKGHSQKLAMAFALIHSSQGSPIRIVRNLRMCSDCHTYTKLISMIYERQITVRDRNFFHHFKDGTCSCNDFW